MGHRRYALNAGLYAAAAGWRLRLRVAVVACLASASAATAARAAPQAFVALEYELAPSASGCPDADRFRASVVRQLGYDPFRPAADKRVTVQIARREGSFDGRIRWSDAGDGRWVGDRRLSSRHSECGDIAASLAFSVAVQVQLLATLALEAPEPAAPPHAPAAPPAPARAPDAIATSAARPNEAVASPAPPPGPAARPARVELSVGVGPSLALGVAPNPTGLGRLFVSGRMARFSLELAADAALPATRHQVDGSGFSLDRFAGAAAACGHARAFAACLTATVGRLEAHGFGVDAPAAPGGWFSQVGGRIVATRDFGGRYFAAARVDALVMVSAWNVTLNETVAWTTPRVGGLIGLDFGAHFL